MESSEEEFYGRSSKTSRKFDISGPTGMVSRQSDDGTGSGEGFGGSRDLDGDAQLSDMPANGELSNATLSFDDIDAIGDAMDDKLDNRPAGRSQAEEAGRAMVTHLYEMGKSVASGIAGLARGDSEEFDKSSIDPVGYRWSWVEIDKKAVIHNVGIYRKLLGPRVKIMAVVKADGYGHGAVECARLAIEAGATWLAVATVKEGMELRDAHIDVPILLLSQPPVESIPALLAYDITTVVYTVDFAMALGEAAAKQDRVAKYHLSVNTGMNRIGVWCEDVEEFLNLISFHKGLKLSGVLTHFATADEHEDYFFNLQLKRFTEAVDTIRGMGIDPGIVHCANSAAGIRYKRAYFDMVRLGICMYGLHPSNVTHNMVDLWPAMSVKGRITAINEVPVGEGVGYGMSYRSPGGVKICTVPIGYADGLSRSLSNRMSVIYKGKLYPQVGNICMDQFMFEIDQRSTLMNVAPEPEIGDEVTIIGTDGPSSVTLDDMADALGTINYELACRFGMRLDKVYK